MSTVCLPSGPEDCCCGGAMFGGRVMLTVLDLPVPARAALPGLDSGDGGWKAWPPGRVMLGMVWEAWAGLGPACVQGRGGAGGWVGGWVGGGCR
jgi:hypothetical protein